MSVRSALVARALVALGFAAALPACDTADPAAALSPLRTSFDVEYRLAGTYSGCRVDFTDRTGLRVTEDVTLPWTRGFRVALQTGDAPFAAGFTTTCADEAREGKSTASLYVDGALRDQRANAGAGAATVVSVTLQPPTRATR